MSYSFGVKAATKALAIAAAAAHFDQQVIPQMPVHKIDREAALANLKTHADLLPEAGPDDEVHVSMHGSVAGDVDWTSGDVRSLSTAGSGCSMSIYRKPQAAA